ncbi:MAG: HAMP domain-containing sensor histidine kinase [Polyangiaceae bacterium]
MLAALAPRTSGAAPIATIPSVTRAARSDVVQRALRGSTQEEGSLVTFRGPGVVGAVAALRGGGFAGFVVTPETLGRALASDPHVGFTKLPRALVASVATGDGGTPTDGAPEGVAFLQAGLGVRVRHRDPRAWRAEARRSERVLVGLLGVGISLAVVLAIVLYRRTRAARRTSELRTSFVASVSHELRTPLASVRMLSELLAEERVEPAERKEVADALAREAVRMTETLDRLMVYAKSERGKLRAARAPLDLSELAAARVAAFVARHPEADVELRAEPETRCEADRAELELAIDNLLENALRHAPEGQPYVVSVRSTRERGTPIIYMRVSDQGPGVPHGARRRIFEPFERGDARLSQAATGTGLGLFLVRAVARAHGGDATLEASEPRGATFTLRFPAFATLERDES